jgi:hypothetical protein
VNELDPERTPVDIPNTQTLLARVNRLEPILNTMAEHVLATRAMVESLMRKNSMLEGRVLALELQRVWFPMVASALALLLSIYGLAQK